MGRIKTQLIKRLTFQLIKKHKDDFKPTFGENKPLVEQRLSGPLSKKLRNTIAGYVTRMMKTREEL